MIECFPFVVPLVCQTTVSVLYESSVHWKNVLLTTNRLNEVLNVGECLLIADGDDKRIPSLTDFWILCLSDIQIIVDSFNDRECDVTDSVQKFTVKHNLKINVLLFI